MTIHQVQAAAELIRDADSILIAAGAGMGVDSGLPDFRGDKGFWKAYPALASDGIGFMDIAYEQAFRDNPIRAWGFYGQRMVQYRQTIPHPGFSILKRWGGQKSHGYFVYTSNVDSQFQKAGFTANRIAECHGSLEYLQCTQPCTKTMWAATDITPLVDEDTCQLTSPLPLCPNCGALARPNVLLFNDYHWVDTRTEAQLARLRNWLKITERPVVIELGAGTTVATVRHFTSRVRCKKQAKMIRINPREFKVTGKVSIGLEMDAFAGLMAIDAVLQNQEFINSKD